MSDYNGKDYYKVLGVSKNAKTEQIKKAFRKIARDNHPDQHPGDKKAEQRFKEASEAHDVLSDPQKRQKYDAERAFGVSGPGGFHFQRNGGTTTTFNGNIEDLLRGMQGGEGLGDIFGGMFGGSRRSSAKMARRGGDVEGSVTLGFQEAIDGATVGVRIVSEEACPACRGTGAKAGTQPKLCDICQGSGVDYQHGLTGAACTHCGGRGVVIESPCASCHGSGRLNNDRVVQVRLPAGVADGQRLRIRGRGKKGENGGKDGDLYVQVHVRPHPIFGRDGQDLTITVPVTFAEAALGAEIEVPTLSGANVKLRLPAGTPNGRVLRVRGRGVTGGDLLVTVDVQVPGQLSDKAKDALRQYQEAAGEKNPRQKLFGVK